jgi:hypothetical protein
MAVTLPYQVNSKVKDNRYIEKDIFVIFVSFVCDAFSGLKIIK